MQGKQIRAKRRGQEKLVEGDEGDILESDRALITDFTMRCRKYEQVDAFDKNDVRHIRDLALAVIHVIAKDHKYLYCVCERMSISVNTLTEEIQKKADDELAAQLRGAVITHNHKASSQKAVKKPKGASSTVQAPPSRLSASHDALCPAIEPQRQL
jgi:nucleoside-diphosphate-sugar epimerase